MARVERDSAPIPASKQFAAVAWLRWRLFANGFRRKGGTGELVARIIVFPIGTLFVVGPVAGASVSAYFATSTGHLDILTGIFWGIFVLQVLVSINISPPGLSFDPESLIRYPLAFPRYLTIRLFLGLLSPSTIIGTCALLGAAAAIAFANPSLAGIAFAVAIPLALCNMFFVRMVFAWVDRWLSTRRAREIFTVLIFAFSLGVQYVNATFNGFGRHSNHAERKAKIDSLLHVYHLIEPYARVLPPSLAGLAIRRVHTSAAISVALIGCILLFAALFLGIFAWRMHREYRGESLSEAARIPKQTARVAHANRSPIAIEAGSRTSRPAVLSPVLAALFEKEWIYVRRNPAQFYGFIAPLAMLFIFAGRLGSLAKTGYIFPAAVAYSVLGLAAIAYNILGLDANGVQFYFMAPIPMRTVILAKNLFSFSITALQLVLVYAVVSFSSQPPPLLIVIASVCWVVLACLVNATVGNMRSIIAPKKMDPSKISRKQTSQLSGLICIGIILALGSVGAGTFALSRIASLPWLPIPILGALALGAFALYITGLNKVDSLALNNREALVEELSKAS